MAKRCRVPKVGRLRILVLALTAVILSPILHEVVPHEQLHAGVAAAQGGPTVTPTHSVDYTRTPTRTATALATNTPFPTVTVTLIPTATSTVTMLPTATKTSTATNTPMPSTPTSTVTSTPMPPTATTAPPTATPGAAGMHEGVPVCAGHNDTIWHPLVQKNAAGAITCTYGHEHHADPNAVNDIFGAPSAWYGGSQSISYPWQTTGTAGHENVVKHEGYKWYVQRDRPCQPASPGEGCFISWRIQVHARGDASDAVARFHSFSIEALVQHPDGTRGTVRHGGHIDTGHLALAYYLERGYACPPLPSNPATFYCGSASPGRRHGGTNMPPSPLGAGHVMPQAAWYPSHSITAISEINFDEWGPIDYYDPTRQVMYLPSKMGNNSRGNIGMIVADIQAYVGIPADADGRVRQTRYTNRSGIIVQGCTAPSVDCVPLVIDGVRFVRYRANPKTLNAEFEVLSPVTGKSLIRFPN